MHVAARGAVGPNRTAAQRTRRRFPVGGALADVGRRRQVRAAVPGAAGDAHAIASRARQRAPMRRARAAATSSCASRSLPCPCSSCALCAVCRVFSRSAAAALAGHCYGWRSYAWLGRPRTRRAVWWPRRTRACGRGRQGWRPPARAALCSFPPKAYSAERENNARASKGICGTTVTVSLCVVVVVFSHTDEYLSELDSLWS